jgi:hypothetical protein
MLRRGQFAFGDPYAGQRLAHGPGHRSARQRRGGLEAGAVALRDQPAAINHGEAAHARTGQAVLIHQRLHGGHGLRLRAGGPGHVRRRRPDRQRFVLITRGRRHVAIRHHGAAGAWTVDRHAVAAKAKQLGAHHLALLVDAHLQHVQYRIVVRLHVLRQHRLRVAPGQEHIRADRLGAIVGGVPQHLRRARRQHQRAAGGGDQHRAGNESEF